MGRLIGRALDCIMSHVISICSLILHKESVLTRLLCPIEY